MALAISKAGLHPTQSILVIDTYPIRTPIPKKSNGSRLKHKAVTLKLREAFGRDRLQVFEEFTKHFTSGIKRQVIFILGEANQIRFHAQYRGTAILVHSFKFNTDEATSSDSIWATLDDCWEIHKLFILTRHTEWYLYSRSYLGAIVGDWLWNFGHSLCGAQDGLASEVKG